MSRRIHFQQKSILLKKNKGVEIIVQVLCAAAVKISVESDEEYLVSRYEKPFKADCQPVEDNAEFEMEIAENEQSNWWLKNYKQSDSKIEKRKVKIQLYEDLRIKGYVMIAFAEKF